MKLALQRGAVLAPGASPSPPRLPGAFRRFEPAGKSTRDPPSTRCAPPRAPLNLITASEGSLLAEATLQRYRHPSNWRPPRAERRLQTTGGEFKEDSPTKPGVRAAAGAVRPHMPLMGVGTCGSRPSKPVGAHPTLQQRPPGLHAHFLVFAYIRHRTPLCLPTHLESTVTCKSGQHK